MFRFSIRDLLWLTVVVALGCLLLIRENQFRAQRKDMHLHIVKLEKIGHEPRVIFVNGATHELPPNTHLIATVEWKNDRTVTVGYKEIPNKSPGPPRDQ